MKFILIFFINLFSLIGFSETTPKQFSPFGNQFSTMRDYLNYMIKTHPNEAKYIEKLSSKVGHQKFPTMTIEKNVIKFSNLPHSLKLISIQKNEFMYGDKVFSLNKNLNFEQSLNEIDKILQPKSAYSPIQLLLPPAHAIAPVVAAAATVYAGIGAFYLTACTLMNSGAQVAFALHSLPTSFWKSEGVCVKNALLWGPIVFNEIFSSAKKMYCEKNVIVVESNSGSKVEFNKDSLNSLTKTPPIERGASEDIFKLSEKIVSACDKDKKSVDFTERQNPEVQNIRRAVEIMANATHLNAATANSDSTKKEQLRANPSTQK